MTRPGSLAVFNVEQVALNRHVLGHYTENCGLCKARAMVSRSIDYHIALAVGIAVALTVEPTKKHGFVTGEWHVKKSHFMSEKG